jgi:glycosyltransferase involved in cell wall biosynthesis
MIINKIKPWKVKFITDASELDPKNDVLLFFPFLSIDSQALEGGVPFSEFNGLKLFHLSHYFSETETVCSILNEVSNAVIIGDGGINRSALYRKFIRQEEYYLLPFALKDRYVSKTPFLSRKSKCLSAGTKSKICPNNHKEFLEAFQSPYLHRLRGEIYDKAHEIKEFVDSLIYDFDELSDEKPVGRFDRLMRKIWKKIGNDRRKFFSFDIVQKYNEYQMFVSPEEESGAPSIAFIEGMACGCAYIGRPEFYIDFGMVPGEHFIPYDGTLLGLVEQVRYYQNHPELAEKIAKNGKEFVEQHFNPDTIANNFWSFLECRLKSMN